MITFQGQADAPEFERYLIRHQVERDIDAHWREHHLRHVVENRRFHAFFNRQRSYLLTEANKQDSRNAMKRLSTIGSDISVAGLPSINPALLEKLGETEGGYFGNLKIAKVRVAALFGHDVADSDDWRRYEEAGEVSALIVRTVTPEDEIRPFLLTRERIVQLYTDTGEESNLRFVAYIHGLIDEELAQLPQD